MKKNKILLSIALFTCFLFSNCANTSKENGSLNTETLGFSVRKFGTDYSSKSEKPSVNEINALGKLYPNDNELLKNISNSIDLDVNMEYLAIGEFYSEDSELIAYEIYYFDDYLMHSLFKISESGSFNKIFELKDNGKMNIANIEFILTYELKEYSISKYILNVNNSFELEKTSGSSEMELYKTAKLFQLDKNENKSNKSVNYELVDEMSAGVCAGCYATLVWGNCSAFGGCNSGCKAQTMTNSSQFKTAFPGVDLLDNKKEYYELRDNVLYTSEVGKKFINYYYSISSYINVSDLSISDMSLIVSMLPNIDNAVNKVLHESKNRNEVIIDEDLKNKALSLISRLKSKTTNFSYNLILQDLESDINKLSLKSKSTFEQELRPIEK